jgi:DNA polymerase III psi subunit
MYNEINLYYLNQIGITPWVSANSLKNNLVADEPKAVTLLVLTPDALSQKERNLLDHILLFLGLAEDKVVRHAMSNGVPPQLLPSAMVSFGLVSQSEHTITDLPSLADLLTHPIIKKKTFNQLLPLKKQFTSI